MRKTVGTESYLLRVIISLINEVSRDGEVQFVKVDSWAEALAPLQAVTPHTNIYKVTWMMIVEADPAVTHACRQQQPGLPGASGASPRGRGRSSRGSEASGSSSIWIAVWKNVLGHKARGTWGRG